MDLRCWIIILNQLKVLWICTRDGHNLSFHETCLSKVHFQSNMCIWLILDGICMLVMLVLVNG